MKPHLSVAALIRAGVFDRQHHFPTRTKLKVAIHGDFDARNCQCLKKPKENVSKKFNNM